MKLCTITPATLLVALLSGAASGQATVTSLPGSPSAVSPAGDAFLIQNGSGGLNGWTPTLGAFPVPFGSASGRAISDGAHFVAGNQHDPVLGLSAPGSWSQAAGVWTPFGLHPATTLPCGSIGDANVISADGSVIGGWVEEKCFKIDGFTWNATSGYTLMDSEFPAGPERFTRVEAMSADGKVMAGFDFKKAVLWDEQGQVISYPLVSASDPAGAGNIVDLSSDGSAFAGNIFINFGTGATSTAFLIRNGVFTDLHQMIGQYSSEVHAISGDGRTVAGSYKVDSSPWTPGTPFLYSTFAGLTTPDAFFAQFGLASSLGVADISASSNQFVRSSESISLVDGFTDLGGASPGSGGLPELDGFGWLVPGANAGVSVTNAAPSSVAFFVYGFSYTQTPLLGGTLGVWPIQEIISIPTQPNGEFEFAFTWPAIFSAGTTIYAQVGVLDQSAQGGIALSNSLQLTGS